MDPSTRHKGPDCTHASRQSKDKPSSGNDQFHTDSRAIAKDIRRNNRSKSRSECLFRHMSSRVSYMASRDDCMEHIVQESHCSREFAHFSCLSSLVSSLSVRQSCPLHLYVSRV